MIRCPKCNKELENGTKFCGACGAQIFETSPCPNGEEKTAPVQKCETDIAGNNKIPENINEHSTQKKNIFRSFPKKAVIFGGIGVVVLVAIILLFIKFSGSGNKDNFSLYLKDNKIVSDCRKSPAKLGFFCCQRYNRNGDEGC